MMYNAKIKLASIFFFLIDMRTGKKKNKFQTIVFTLSLGLLFGMAFVNNSFANTSFAKTQQETSYPVSSPISSGVIKNIYVSNGQQVKQGELLFEFDDRLINSNLDEARATVRMAKLKAVEAKKDVERSQELYERTVLSDYELQQSKIRYNEALVGLSQAKNKLAHAQWDKGYSKVYAPFSGLVKKILCYSGCYINNNVATQIILIMEKE